MTEKKKQEFLAEIARELKKKHNFELYKDCISIAGVIYNLAINDEADTSSSNEFRT